MLSQETIIRLDRLYEQQDNYQPSDDVKRQLANKQAVLMVGATCQGKNTIMQELVQLDNRFTIIGTIVSRPPRKSDAGLPYTYYQHSDSGLSPILDDIEQHKVVQYAINPYSRFLYASKLSDYAGEYNIGDYFSSAVAPFRTLGFRSALAVTVVSPVQDWLARFDERFPLGHSDRQARRDEAIESLTWSLTQTADHVWVVNRLGLANQAAAELVAAITKGKELSSEEARKLGEATLQAALELGT